ncbi:MAG: sigma-70 family RNA polymerase sigma factor [Prevotellaceae bacterium]|jgi:RNA polymerase sigma-70 factor (ECF subfamily)|nr:sigma-70 family RNA polymerase sigma factor [Prevotellaceae bacterium]
MNTEKCLQQSSKHEEIELIIRLKNGDEQAFTSIVCLYRNKLLGYLFRMIGSIEETKDIVQDVFMKIWEGRENIDKINNLETYIFKMAKNRMIDTFRKFPKDEICINITEENLENLLLEKEKQQILQEAVNHLPPRQKEVYKSHFDQEKPLKKIAQETNTSLSAVQNNINKAIKNIRKYFAKKYL